MSNQIGTISGSNGFFRSIWNIAVMSIISFLVLALIAPLLCDYYETTPLLTSRFGVATLSDDIDYFLKPASATDLHLTSLSTLVNKIFFLDEFYALGMIESLDSSLE